MRILVVSGSRPLCLLLDQHLQQHALAAEVVEPEAALAACDEPVVILHIPRWDAPAARTARRLGERTDRLFVVRPEALRPAVRLAIAKGGAHDGFPDDAASLRLLALQVQRLIARSLPTRLELGPLVLDVLQGTLSTPERSHVLTPAEIRLLLALWPTGAARTGVGLPGGQLAGLAHMPEPSVRNHVEYLRGKLADLVGDVVVLGHQRGRGYRLAVQDDSPRAEEGADAR